MTAHANPYAAQPDSAFWRRSVAGCASDGVDPVSSPPFHIGREDRVATAGSCFAQHISRTLAAQGYNYLVTETAPSDGGSVENYGVYPARFGNIYSVRQLLQTFDRAYGLFRPRDNAWGRPDGRWVDPFRPQIQAEGFASPGAVEADRRRHLAAVRGMFEECDIFIFTLGLTETWRAVHDGAVFPLAPGVSGGESGPDYVFHNATVEEMGRDLKAFLGKLRVVNPSVRVVLTVSPVPLIATFEPRHVLLSNTYSKAALRVVAEETARADPGVCYFPSYEIITGAHAGTSFFEPDLRSVTEAGVKRVMALFSAHMLGEDARPASVAPAKAELSSRDQARLTGLAELVCDEEAIDP